MVVPRVKLSTRYILSELEEIEREDNFRLKRFKELKMKKYKKILKPEKNRTIEKDNEEEFCSIEKTETAETDINAENSENKLLRGSRTVIRKEENLKKISTEQVEKGIIMEKVPKRVTIETKLSGSLIIAEEIDINDKKVKIGLNMDAVKPEEQNYDNIGDYCSCIKFFPSLEKLTENESIVKGPSETLQQQVNDALRHTEEIFDLVKDNEESQPCDYNCLSTWVELKSVLEEIVLDRICDKCKNKIKRSSEDGTPYLQNLSKRSEELSKLSIPDSIFSIKPENEDKLGNFERNYKESIKVLRIQNEDGTIRQERKVITVKTDKRNPMKSKPFGGLDNVCNKVISKCSCNDLSGESDNSQTQQKNGKQEIDTDESNYNGKHESLYQPTCTKSDPVCGNRQWNDPKVRSCMSAGSVKETMKLDAVNCSCLGDITVNLNFQNTSSENIHSINIRKLPPVSSINLNFCNWPKSTSKESQNDSNLCCGLKQENEMSTVKESTPKVNDDADCLCELDDVFEKTFDKCCQTFNQIGAKIYTMGKNKCTHVTESNNQEDQIRNNACLQLPDFTYIFSKVEKVSLDDPVNAEDCCKKIPEKIFFIKHCTDSTMFAYIFSTIKRMEIDNMLKNACSYAPEFPYVFSKLLRETLDNKSYLPCNSKPSDIGTIFNDACKRTYSCTYIFSHLKGIKINAMFKSSCKKKIDFPYIFSNVKDQNQILINNKTNTAKAEIANMFKNACKRMSDFSYILDHLNIIKIDDMIKEACSQSLEFPYLFSKVDNNKSNENELKSNAIKIDQMFKDGCKRSNNFPYLLSRVKETVSNDTCKASCKDVKKHVDIFSYTLKKVSKESNVNKDEINEMFTDACARKNEISFNKSEQATSNQNVCQENDESCKKNNNVVLNSCKCKNNRKNQFKYVYKNEIFKDGIKDISTNFSYTFSKMCDSSTSTSTDTFNYSDFEVMFKQACKHKSDYICDLSKEHHENSNKNLLRASDTKLQSLKKFFQMSCKCTTSPKCIAMKNNIINNNSKHSCKVFAKSDINKSQVNTEKQDSNRVTGSVKCSSVEDLCKESCNTKNIFRYVADKPNLTEQKSCECECCTNDLSLQENASVFPANKCDTEVKTQTKNKTSSSNVSLEFKDCFKIKKMFNDACKQKNEFTYVVTELKRKKTIQLARRTSKLRLEEISMFKDFTNGSIETKVQSYSKKEKKIQSQLKRNPNLPCALNKVSEFIQLSAPTYQEEDNQFLESYLTKDYDSKNKETEVNKLISDSCVVCINPKHNYIFQKDPKSERKDINKCNCLSKRTIESEPHSCASPTSLLYNNISSSLSCIHSQSTCSLTCKNSPQNFLMHILNNMDDSSHLGLKVSCRTPCMHDNEFKTNKIDSNIYSPGESPRGSDSICQYSESGSKSRKNDERPNEHDNISLIRRMLDSVKNVYVPFMKPVKSKVNNNISYSKTDTITSLISNSSTSTYSWKSCVMKTCQAESDAESIKKKLSYSRYSFGSSLNLATYKNNIESSVTNSAVSSETDKKTCCSHTDDNVGAAKHILFGVRIKSVTSVYSTDSNKLTHDSKHVSRNESETFSECKCSSEARTKCAPSSTRGECSHFLDAQNKYTCGLGYKAKPLSTTTYHSLISLRGTCSFTPMVASKQIRETKAECSCTTNQKIDTDNKWNGCCGGSEKYNVRKTKSALKKSRSFDENECCCSKSSYL